LTKKNRFDFTCSWNRRILADFLCQVENSFHSILGFRVGREVNQPVPPISDGDSVCKKTTFNFKIKLILNEPDLVLLLLGIYWQKGLKFNN
jgi:hypothetical protein